MKAAAIEIEDKLDELLEVLDRDIRHINKSLSWLNELRSSVIKRDDTASCKLLENIQNESDIYRSNESKRQSIRKELAIAFDCGVEHVTLSALEAVLPEKQKARIAERKDKLRLLIEELKREHLSTTLLLSECARFNNILLKSILNFGKIETVTYNSKGSARRQNEMALVNLQF
jgi:hypothetical protein